MEQGWSAETIVLHEKFIDDALIQNETFVKLRILPELVSQWCTTQSTPTILARLEHEPSSPGQETAPTAEDDSPSSSNSVTCDQVPFLATIRCRNQLFKLIATVLWLPHAWCYCRQDGSLIT